MNHCAPQDPLLLLVAYADGELAAEARAVLEGQLVDNAELRDRLEGIRALQASLQAHLPTAPLVLDAARRHLVLQIAQPLRVPQVRRWWTINRLAAACLAVAMLGLFLAIPETLESRISATSRRDAYEERGQAAARRIAPINAPTTSGAASTPAPVAGFIANGGGSGGAAFATDLDVPEPRSEVGGVMAGSLSSLHESTKENATENETIVATAGLEEAAADSIKGGDGDAGEVDADKAKDAFKRFRVEGLKKKSEERQLESSVDLDGGKPLDGRQTRTTESPARSSVLQPNQPVMQAEQAQEAQPVMQQAQAAKPPASPSPPVLYNSLVNDEDRQGIQSSYMSSGASSDLKAASAGRQKPQQNSLSNNRPSESVLLVDAVANGFPLLQNYRSQGWQYFPVGDTINLVNGSDNRPLDPTATFGLAKADFKKAFGTVPMAATADTATLTFAFTADTATFDRARAQLRRGQAVEANAIQAEHFINAVPAGYPAASGPEAFNLYAEAGPSPFAAGSLAPRTALVCVGAVARPAGSDERRPLALTLAIDCSGSMAQPGGLERIRTGLNELFARLGADDSVAIVAFGDRARVVLPATPGAERARIAAAVAGLQTGGSTNAAEGLSLAYQLAAESAKPGRESRVLLATDGATLTGGVSSAVGSTSANAAAEPILARIAADRARGITLIVVGCGTQQHEQPQQTEATMDVLAAKGDGQHYYVGSDDEARQLFSDKLVPAKLGVLARDAKVQVTWNPQRVTHARLIGFESRRLSAQDFRNDRVDAGEIAHDTQATALFEVILAEGGSGPLGTAAVRYFDTRLNQVRELACPLPGSLVHSRVSPRLRLMACSADLADLLGRTWWANQRCATYAGLLAELARCEPSQFRDQLQAMATRAQQLTNEP